VEHLAARLGCDICPITEKRRRTMFTIFMDMMFQRFPAIEAIQCSVADYDHVILIAPIWGSKVANPLKSFITQEKAGLADYSFISLCGHGTPEQHAAITQELTTLAGHPPSAVTELRIRELMPAEKKDDVKEITRYRATKDDLPAFESQISAFINHGDIE